MAYKVRIITFEDIEAMKVLVERKGLKCGPWCEGVQNYYLDTFPKELQEIKKDIEPTNQKLKRCISFLHYLGVDTSGSFIPLTPGGCSCVMNKDTEWKDFIGASANSVAEFVAKELGKPTKFLEPC